MDKHGILASMSRGKGNCWGKVATETLFGLERRLR
jgi:hypothetical protein